MREAKIYRRTDETEVQISINIDGEGKADINTGIKFFDHMLKTMAKHGQFNLNVKCVGDLEIDTHHTVEDIGIVLGKAIKKAIGSKEGIKRYGLAYTPMDESLSRIAIDMSGRSFLVYNVEFTREFVGDFETETLREFFTALTNNAELTLHINLLYGSNNHHIIESVFKGFGRAFKEAVSLNENIKGVLSTKGVL
ncbi:imidazoleglycerol-phosphate dehydratase [Caminicella sporogenes DSM 14501]|uniref:Imidazoleglycerol-phosphate dehydratase n=1 Tax=Caminicella sporogenes DSM 14501 TaxID=1121266 RepID=A0A1M6S489_9FIRM|nr:imidazoleglycerol-phosphate dehydratase HisB [Caminicella sporogenes]RKD27193.1 imidazoleglycerol-phosphate dehydratase [Caminicella sporogenes]SHK39654.1 imidazoleglycerol-phosphate dehydratase [Caminicella sporogenes DSM 14501]